MYILVISLICVFFASLETSAAKSEAVIMKSYADDVFEDPISHLCGHPALTALCPRMIHSARKLSNRDNEIVRRNALDVSSFAKGRLPDESVVKGKQNDDSMISRGKLSETASRGKLPVSSTFAAPSLEKGKVPISTAFTPQSLEKGKIPQATAFSPPSLVKGKLPVSAAFAPAPKPVAFAPPSPVFSVPSLEKGKIPPSVAFSPPSLTKGKLPVGTSFEPFTSFSAFPKGKLDFRSAPVPPSLAKGKLQAKPDKVKDPSTLAKGKYIYSEIDNHYPSFNYDQSFNFPLRGLQYAELQEIGNQNVLFGFVNSIVVASFLVGGITWLLFDLMTRTRSATSESTKDHDDYAHIMEAIDTPLTNVLNENKPLKKLVRNLGKIFVQLGIDYYLTKAFRPYIFNVLPTELLPGFVQSWMGLKTK